EQGESSPNPFTTEVLRVLSTFVLTLCLLVLLAAPAFADAAAAEPSLGQTLAQMIIDAIPGLVVALIAWLKAHSAHAAAANAAVAANSWDKAAIDIVAQIAQGVVDADKAAAAKAAPVSANKA